MTGHRPTHTAAAWRDAAHLAEHLDQRDAAARCRLRLATTLYTNGDCIAGIREPDIAAQDWLTRHPQISPTSCTLLPHATFMRIGCHRHTETHRYPLLRHLHAATSAHTTAGTALQLLDEAGNAAVGDSRTFQPGPCCHETCHLRLDTTSPLPEVHP